MYLLGCVVVEIWSCLCVLVCGFACLCARGLWVYDFLVLWLFGVVVFVCVVSLRTCVFVCVLLLCF